MTEIVPGLVSTIIPTYNRIAMLQESVESVLAQTWRPIEIVISDDGSRQDAVEAALDLKSCHAEIRYVLLNQNRGAGPAREAGRQLARGEFIQYLDSDDRLLPRKFESQIEALRRQPHCGAAYGQIRLFGQEGTLGESPHKWSGRKLDRLFPHLLVDRWWNTDAPLWRRSVCDRIGPWSDLRYSQDWEYDARAGALGIELAYCPEFVCEQRHHTDARQTGHGGWLTPTDQVRFFSTLHDCAVRAGVSQSAPEMQHFSRWVFSQARQCGSMGDVAPARELFKLALRAAVSPDLKMRVTGALASVIGWKFAGRLGQLRDSLFSSPGPSTLKQSWMREDR